MSEHRTNKPLNHTFRSLTNCKLMNKFNHLIKKYGKEKKGGSQQGMKVRLTDYCQDIKYP